MARWALFCICFALLTPARAASPLDLDQFRGRVVYLDFWASWCGPCKQSFPWMQTLSDTYAGRGLTVVAVNLDVNRADAEKFLHQFRPTFEVRFDPKGDFAASYQVKGMPSSVLIDRHGVPRYTHVGFLPIDGSALEAQVQELLAEM